MARITFGASHDHKRFCVFFSQKSPALKRQLHALASSFEKPAGLIQYVDDVTAGHLLAPSHGRSFTAYRFSFKEFGRLLFCQEMWFEYAILRTEIGDKVVGSHSYILRVLLHLFFTSNESFSRVGALADGPTEGEPLVIYARNSGIIADGKAHKQNYGVKGASGLMPCDCCDNVVAKGLLDPYAARRISVGGDNVDICCPTLALCRQRSSQDIFDDADNLHSLYPRMKDRGDRAINKGDFEQIEQATGITYNPDGVLLDLGLRDIAPPLETIKKDWAHIYVCKGIASDEMWMLFPRLKAVGVTRVNIKSEMEGYTWPKHQRTGSCVNAQTAFGEKRWESCTRADTFKVGGSETLAIFPVLLEVTAACQTQLPAEYACLSKMCKIIDTILAMKYGHVEISARNCTLLQDTIEDHFVSHMDLYGMAHIVPKWHDALHLAKQFLKDGTVFDTITNERDHQNCKAFGDLMKGHMPAFDRFVLARSIAFQLKRLQCFSEFGKLEGRVEWSRELGAECGSAISLNGMHVAVDEFVKWSGKVIRVKCCGKAAGELFLLGVVCKVPMHK